jgi:hypothetical protein
MNDYVFRLYFADEREHFEYGKKNRIEKKSFPMMDSLLSFLDMDVMSDDMQFREMEEALQDYRGMQDRKSLALVRARLDALAGKHILYEALRLEWLDRIERAADAADADAFDRIAWPKELRQIPSRLYAVQRHIEELFESVLLYGTGKERIRDRAARYYADKNKHAREIDYYSFGQITTVCEAVSASTITDVLYASSIFDVLDFYVRACIMEEYPVRRCKNCGKWFILTGHNGLEYCTRLLDEKGHTCRDIGAGLGWEKRSRSDKPFTAYRKEYKKRFARIKAGRITEEQFHEWGERARAKKQECDEGLITLDEFVEWLEIS